MTTLLDRLDCGHSKLLLPILAPIAISRNAPILDLCKSSSGLAKRVYDDDRSRAKEQVSTTSAQIVLEQLLGDGEIETIERGCAKGLTTSAGCFAAAWRASVPTARIFFGDALIATSGTSEMLSPVFTFLIVIFSGDS